MFLKSIFSRLKKNLCGHHDVDVCFIIDGIVKNKEKQILIEKAVGKNAPIVIDDVVKKIEAEVLAECQFHGAFDAKRIAKDVAPKIAKILLSVMTHTNLAKIK